LTNHCYNFLNKLKDEGVVEFVRFGVHGVCI